MDPRRVRCRVVLPRRQVLVREFELPLAAEENLREVLGFEMSRRTPFRAQDVHFDFQVVSRDSTHQRLKLRLEVVPRTVLAPVLAGLRAWELSPAPGVAQHRAPEDAGYAAFGFQASGFDAHPHSRLNMVLGLAVVTLMVAVVWLPFERQRDYRQELEGQVAQARLAAARVASLRDELSAERDARALVINARGERPSMVALLEELTRALPDGTFLFRLEVDGNEVNLHGSSDGASRLIAILEDTPHLRGVRFASPVTRDGTTGHERFHIVATLASGSPAGAVES